MQRFLYRVKKKEYIVIKSLDQNNIISLDETLIVTS